MAAEVVRSTPTWDEREIVERRWGGGGGERCTRGHRGEGEGKKIAKQRMLLITSELLFADLIFNNRTGCLISVYSTKQCLRKE